MKKYTLLILTLILSFILIGCVKSNDKKITVVDIVGDKTTIKKNPTKIAAVSRTTYDLLVAFGLGDKIDGAYKGTLKNSWLNHIYPKSKEHFQYGYRDSFETFLKRGVDLVFAPEKYIADDLRAHGINAVCVSLYGNPTFDNYVTFFSNLIKQIWDDEKVLEKANKWEKEITNAINEIKETLKKHNVKKRSLYYVRGDKKNGVEYTDLKGSFLEYAYRVLNIEYIGKNLKTNRPQYEEIIRLNPDIITLGGIYQKINYNILKSDKYNTLNAVKNNNVFNIPVAVSQLEQISAMSSVFLRHQANLLYPDIFEYNIKNIIKTNLKEYFNFDIKDNEVDYMLNGLNPVGMNLYE